MRQLLIREIYKFILINLLTFPTLIHAQAASEIQVSPPYKLALREHRMMQERVLGITRIHKSPVTLARIWKTDLIPANRRILASLKNHPPIFAMDLDLQMILKRYEAQLLAEYYYITKPTPRTLSQLKRFQKAYSAQVQIAYQRNGSPKSARGLASDSPAVAAFPQGQSPPPLPPMPPSIASGPQARLSELALQFSAVSIASGKVMQGMASGEYPVMPVVMQLKKDMPERLQLVKAELSKLKLEPNIHPLVLTEANEFITVCDLEIKYFAQVVKLIETGDPSHKAQMAESERLIRDWTERFKLRNQKPRGVASQRQPNFT